MTILYKGYELGSVLTNHSMTIEEAVSFAFADAETEYNSGNPAVYIDDEGAYCWDYDYMKMGY